MAGKQISVGIADMKITRQEGILITYALGSCIGISFYDPMMLTSISSQTRGSGRHFVKYRRSGQ